MAANSSSSLIFFVLLTLGYSMAKYYTKSESTLKIWSIIYFLVLILVQFFINVSITNDICGFSQYSVALYTTLVPWIMIFGLLNILLLTFPGWLSPFSNTIGYGFCYITGINSFFKNILKDRNAMQLDKSKSGFVQAIDNIYEDKSLLINSLSMSELPIWWENMKKVGLLKNNVGAEQYAELHKYIKMKDGIAEFIWFVLTGGLVTSMSYNYIVNSGCTQSASEMKKRHDEYVEKEKKISETKKDDNNEMVYKSFE